MTAVLTKNKLESIPNNNIFSVINNRSNIPDPRNTSDTIGIRQFVLDSDPFGKAINFSDFPYIIVEFPILEYSAVSTDGKVKTLNWTQTITIRAARDGSANTRQGVGRQDMLDIGDNLQSTFNNETIKQQLRELRLFMMNLTKLSVDTLFIDNQSVYEAVYQLTYMERIQVSD